MKQAFRHIKYLLCTAPALGLPDYKLPFHLYVAESGLVASAVLAQTHGDKLRPVAYYSKTLPLIVQGMVLCLRAVAAAAIMVQKAQTIVLGHPLTLHTTHSVNIILLNITTQHMTNNSQLLMMT
uniref:Reverse transcriptase/retrotransposon-derived protein RNase H-like domain-containing protein n=1 Tax=Amphiprion percula TaxID=161767 RepID=A0A3P8SVS2_AMPPE